MKTKQEAISPIKPLFDGHQDPLNDIAELLKDIVRSRECLNASIQAINQRIQHGHYAAVSENAYLFRSIEVESQQASQTVDRLDRLLRRHASGMERSLEKLEVELESVEAREALGLPKDRLSLCLSLAGDGKTLPKVLDSNCSAGCDECRKAIALAVGKIHGLLERHAIPDDLLKRAQEVLLQWTNFSASLVCTHERPDPERVDAALEYFVREFTTLEGELRSLPTFAPQHPS